MKLGARLELTRIDPRQNARRFYCLATFDDQLELFASDEAGDAGDVVILVVTYGRLGRRKRVVRKAFTDLEPLKRTWNRLVARRLAHGYRESR